MQPRIKALRAVTSRYALDTIRPLFVGTIIALVAVSALIIFLVVKVSAWWFLFFLPLLIVGIPLVVLLFVAGFIAQRIAPIMTREQRKAAVAYVRNMQEVSEGLQTPQFIIVFKILRDVVQRKTQNGFVAGMTTNSVRLKKDFDALAKLFGDS